jgi:hypothetical protein
MNLLRNSLLMRKTGDRRRTELTEIFAFLCGFPAEFITRSRGSVLRSPLVWSLRSALRKDMLQLYLLSREPFTLSQGRFLRSF